MSQDVRAEIAVELGVPAAMWVGTLPEADAQALLVLIRDARRRQREALQRSIDEALLHVPRVLRGALRRVLFA